MQTASVPYARRLFNTSPMVVPQLGVRNLGRIWEQFDLVAPCDGFWFGGKMIRAAYEASTHRFGG
jgi:hypothetical protein